MIFIMELQHKGVGDGSPYQYGDTYIYPVVPPGYWGTMNRGIDNVDVRNDITKVNADAIVNTVNP